MIENDQTFAEKRKLFYENHYRAAEPIDPWHAYAQTVVHSTTRKWFSDFGRAKGERILNAGSGGSDYGIKLPMIHLDLAADRIAHFSNHLVGNISSIPIADQSFDVVLCVGSVLNYSNPMLGIREFERVLRPGGLLILEYERSASPEYWRKHGVSAACVRVDTFYGEVETQLWAYGDQFIDGLLALNSFKTVNEFRFHGISSAVLAVSGSAKFASHFVLGDLFLANFWPIRYLASNRILAVEKLA